MSLEALLSFLSASGNAVVLTGAGVSTASGIPDFRGPQGIWKRRQPVYFDEFLASEEKRIEYWDYKCEGFELFRAAVPNAAHRALALLERTGRLLCLLTQNIDGLHQAAGNRPQRVLELHGSNRWVECLSCHSLSDPERFVATFRASRKPPRCDCGGLLKFATISFGQSIRADVLSRAIAAMRRADLVLALGSTLSVHPAASLPLVALERGVPYVIVNQGATDHDASATLKIEGDVVAIIPPAIEALAEKLGIHRV